MALHHLSGGLPGHTHPAKRSIVLLKCRGMMGVGEAVLWYCGSSVSEASQVATLSARDKALGRGSQLVAMCWPFASIPRSYWSPLLPPLFPSEPLVAPGVMIHEVYIGSRSWWRENEEGLLVCFFPAPNRSFIFYRWWDTAGLWDVVVPECVRSL